MFTIRIAFFHSLLGFCFEVKSVRGRFFMNQHEVLWGSI